MKLLSTVALVFLCHFIHAQTTVTVTLSGIGDIKLGMKQSELERLLNQPLKLPHVNAKDDDDYNQDTVHINYKGLEADVVFQREYIDEKKYNALVWEVRSSSPQLKTRSGIGIGDDKYKIISTYEGYIIWIMPEYEDDNYSVKSKTKSSVWLHDDNGNVIIFYLNNNKVTGMSVTYEEEGD